MSQIILSKRKAEAISNGVFLVGIGILFLTNGWWPGILLVIWAALATRQYFTGRIWDFSISTVILVGLFITTFFNITWSVLMPVLFVIGGIYIIFREYFFTEDIIVIKKPEDIDIEDDSELPHK